MDEPILIVDDDVNLNRLLAKFLERNGFPSATAYSAEEAIKILSSQKFRIVLTDLRLPHKDGLELLQWISGHDSGCRTVLMTNYADVQTAVKAMKLGAADYIAKPIIPDDLLKKIEDVLVSSMDTTRARTDSYLASMQGFLDVVISNRMELSSGSADEEETREAQPAEEQPQENTAAPQEKESSESADEDLKDLDVPEHFFNGKES